MGRPVAGGRYVREDAGCRTDVPAQLASGDSLADHRAPAGAVYGYAAVTGVSF
jgi:hypothetical protein